MKEGVRKIYIAHSLGYSERVLHYVKFLESLGHLVYFPMRDTKQEGTTPRDVLRQNLAGIIWADEVHVIWNGKSYGTIFDLGNTYALGKPIRIIHVRTIEEEMSKLHKRSWYSYLYSNIGKTLEEYSNE